MSTQSTTQNASSPSAKATKLTMSVVGITITSLLFAVPLGLVYNFVYVGSDGGLFPNFMVFLLSYLFGFVANLLFYRIIVMNDMDAQINKVQYNTVAYVMGLTLCGFTVLFLTLFALAISPNLLTIFEDTFGYWFVGIMGLNETMQKIFSSGFNDTIVRSGAFNYNFLITCLHSEDDVDALKTKPTSIDKMDIAFTVNPSARADNWKSLKYFVDLKRTFGHYMWTYFASVLSIMISMIAIIIGSS